MRGMSIVVLVLITVIVVGVGLLVLNPSSLPRASAILSRIAASTRSPSSAIQAQPAPKPPEIAKHGTLPKDLRRTESPETAVSMRSASAASPSPFPLGQDIVNGTPKAEILERFGVPQATITGADLGRLQERLVYVDKSSRRKTLIFLLNERVVAAQTYVE
jgi:hypothetical protein